MVDEKEKTTKDQIRNDETGKDEPESPRKTEKPYSEKDSKDTNRKK